MLEKDRGGGEGIEKEWLWLSFFQQGFKKLQWKSYKYAFLYHVQIVMTVMVLTIQELFAGCKVSKYGV